MNTFSTTWATRNEPFRLYAWIPKAGAIFPGRLFTCARPGRSNGREFTPIPDEYVRAWAKGLPAAEALVIVSLLGRKTDGTSEFSFYSFRGGFEASTHRPDSPTFQEWLDREFGLGRYQVLEYPTVDTELIAPDTKTQVVSRIVALLRDGRTVVLVDSGGIGRTGNVAAAVAKAMGLRWSTLNSRGQAV